MRVIKRDGTEVPFDNTKIRAAVESANREVGGTDQLSERGISFLTFCVTKKCEGLGRSVSVEEIQDMIVDELELKEKYVLMRRYMEYRYAHALLRKGNSTDGRILALLERSNEEALQENANKNPVINSTMRDYMAGEVSRDLVRRFFMPEDVMRAHDEGILHVHKYNCGLAA